MPISRTGSEGPRAADDLLPAAVAALRHQHTGDEAAAARALVLDASADQYLDGQRPANTRAAYAQDWANWEAYTRWAQIPVLSGGRGALVASPSPARAALRYPMLRTGPRRDAST